MQDEIDDLRAELKEANFAVGMVLREERKTRGQKGDVPENITRKVRQARVRKERIEAELEATLQLLEVASAELDAAIKGYSGLQRQAAIDQINADEAALHRQFLLSNAALLTNRDVTAAKEGRDKKSAERGEVSITEKELLDYINDQREAEGEEPFRTLRDARNGLAGTDKYNQYYQDAIDAKAGETKIAEPAPVPAGRGSQDRQAMSIYDQFLLSHYLLLRKNENQSMQEFFDYYFDQDGKLTRDRFSTLAYGLDEYLRSRGGYSDVDIQNMVARLVDYMEDMYRRGFQ